MTDDFNEITARLGNTVVTPTPDPSDSTSRIASALERIADALEGRKDELTELLMSAPELHLKVKE